MVAVSLDNLAVSLATANKFAGAAEAYRESLAIRDFEDGSSLRNLALVLIADGKYKEAESYLKRALPLVEKSPDLLIQTLNDYAGVLDRLGRKMESTKFHARAKQAEASIKK